jgi:hypothetical protein
MNIKLRGLLLAAVVVGATASAFAGTGGLIGERHVSFGLGYSDYDDGGHLTTGTVEFNAPSSIRGLDLGFDAGYGDGGYSVLDYSVWQAGASATGYLSLQNGIKPFLTARLGYERDRYAMDGYSDGDGSFIYSVGAGVEIPFCAKGAIRLGFGYYDLTDYEQNDGVTIMAGANYWITEKIALRGTYTRDCDLDSNTFTLGVAVRY